MRAALVILLFTACAPVLPPVDAARFASEQCARQRVTCVHNGGLPRPPYEIDGIVSVSPAWCGRDPALCEFAIAHEAGHVYGARDEPAADCYATRHSSPAARAAALTWLAFRERLGDGDVDARRAAIYSCAD